MHAPVTRHERLCFGTSPFQQFTSAVYRSLHVHSLRQPQADQGSGVAGGRVHLLPDHRLAEALHRSAPTNVLFACMHA